MKTPPNRFLNETSFTEGLQVRLYKRVLEQPYELHWHEFYEMIFILSGTGVNTINGVKTAVKPGDAVLLTPTDFHEIAPDEGCALEHYNLIFSQVMLSDDMISLIFSEQNGCYARFENPRDFEGMVFRFESIMREYVSSNPGRMLAAQSELNSLLIDWHRHRMLSHETREAVPSLGNELRLATHQHSGIQKALIYIQHHFRQTITLEDAANQANLSPNYFSELFRKSTGVTFQTYLQRLRLHFAQSLLQTSSLPITEVSYVSGFNTLTHFERVFRSHFGMTPRESQKMFFGNKDKRTNNPFRAPTNPLYNHEH